MLKCEMRRA